VLSIFVIQRKGRDHKKTPLGGIRGSGKVARRKHYGGGDDTWARGFLQGEKNNGKGTLGRFNKIKRG